MSTETLADLQREVVLRRRLDIECAKKSFLHYYRRMTGFWGEPHHILICDLIQKWQDDYVDPQGRRLDRLMLFLPPRTAKTTIGNHLACSWIMGRDPTTAIMSGAHTQRYANKIGAQVRKFITAPSYPFEAVLSADTRAKFAWATTDGGEYNGFGLRGGSTHGNPAEHLVLDDLIKGREMALSEYQREEAWETYQADLVSRLQGRRKQLMIMTRWHEDDIAGRILPEDYDGSTGWYQDRETGEWWFVLALAARAEHKNDPLGRKIGEYMWPERFGEAAWGPIEKRGGWMWSAIYQQRPAPADGLYFRSEHIQKYNLGSLNRGELRVYITCDYAVTAEAGAPDPDYTVFTVWGVDPDYNVYMLDMWRGRTTPDVWIEQLIGLIRMWRPIWVGEERGQILSTVGPFLSQRMREERVTAVRRRYTSHKSKEARASGIQGVAAMGRFWLPRGHPMTSVFQSELMSFPGGKHDDMVDTASLMGRMMDEIISGKREEDRSGVEQTIASLLQSHIEAQEKRRKEQE